MPSQEEFEDKFRKKFEDWETPAPAWESFQPLIPPQKNEKKSKRFWLWWCVGCVVMIAGLGGIYVSTIRQYQPIHTSQIATQTQPPKNKEANPSTAHKSIQKSHIHEKTSLNVQPDKDSHHINTHKKTNKAYASILPDLPTHAGKDSSNTLINLPTYAGKDSSNTLINSPTYAGKDSSNTLINLPTYAGKDSSNTLINLPTHAGKDSSNTLINSPENKIIAQKPDSAQHHTTNRQIFIAQVLPILPLKNEFATPNQTYKMDSTWKRDAKQNTVGKWAIAGYFAPIFTYKIVTPNTKDSIFIENFVANTRMANQNRGYQIGGRIERRLGKRIGVYGGLQYQYTRLQTDYVYYATGQSSYRVDSAYQNKLYLTPIIPRNQVGDALLYHSLLAEAGVHYRVRLGRWESVLGAGVGYQYALKLYFKNGSERYETPYQAHHFLTQASLQIGYALTPQKKIFIEPTLQNNHTRLFKGGLYDLRTYQVGWRVGLKWRL
jgi:hypothetical protein